MENCAFEGIEIVLKQLERGIISWKGHLLKLVLLPKSVLYWEVLWIQIHVWYKKYSHQVIHCCWPSLLLVFMGLILLYSCDLCRRGAKRNVLRKGWYLLFKNNWYLKNRIYIFLIEDLVQFLICTFAGNFRATVLVPHFFDIV